MKTFSANLLKIYFICNLICFIYGSVSFAAQPFVKKQFSENEIYSDRLIVKFKSIPDKEMLHKIAPGRSNFAQPLIVKFQPFYPAEKTLHSELNKSKAPSQLYKL